MQTFQVRMKVRGVAVHLIEAEDVEEAQEIAESMAFDELVSGLEDVETAVVEVDGEEIDGDVGDEDDEDFSQFAAGDDDE